MSKLAPDYIEWVLSLNATQAQGELHKLDKANKELQKQTNATRKAMAQLEAEGKKGSVEWNNLSKSIEQNNRVMAQNRAKMDEVFKRVDLASMSAAQLSKVLKGLKKNLNNTSKALDPEGYRKLEKEIIRTEEALAKAQRSTRSFMSSFMSLDKIATSIKGFFMGLGMVITTQVIGAFKNLVSTIQDFERANSKLAAVLGTSFEGVSKLTEQAKYLGRTTTATASQVTGLQTELAKLGFSQDVIEKLTPATLKFAKAVDTDLSSAAAFAGAAMRMFNKDAGEADEVLASFAVATTKSALDFNKLQASLSTVGPVANSFGFSLEETTALLGQLSNAGFDASSAATATRNILLNLADVNGDLAKALGGPVTNLDEMVAGLRKLNGEGIDLAKALELTDKRSVAAFSTFLNGADNILTLRDSITGCTADFNDMAATMTDNAAGSWAGFTSAVEGLILKFFDWREALKTLYEWATEVINWVGSIVDAFHPLGIIIGNIAGAFGWVVSQAATLVGWFTKLFAQTKAGKIFINGLVAALIAYKTASMLATVATKNYYTSMVTAMKGALAYVKALALKAKAMMVEAAANLKAAITTRAFNKELLLNPILFVISLIAALTAAIIGYSDATDDAIESQRELNEVEEIRKKNREDLIKRSDEMNNNLAVERDRIAKLLDIAGNEAISKERREKAIKRLNEICPEYNGYIDAETGALKGAKKALDEYLISLEKKARMEYYKESYEQYVKDIEDGQRKMQRMYDNTLKREVRRRAELIRQSAPELDLEESYTRAYNQLYNEWLHGDLKDEALSEAVSDFNMADAALHELKADFCDLQVDMRKAGIDLADILTEEVTKNLNTTNTAAAETVSRLKEINAELKRLRKIDPQSDEELDRIRKRIELLQQERKELMGKAKIKREPGTYGPDSLDEVTAPVDDAHQRRLLEINKSDMAETERTIAKNRELIRYCDELTSALDTLREKTDSTHTKTLDAINAEQNKLAQQSATAQLEINKALMQQDKTGHEERLKACEAFYKNLSDLNRAQVMADSDFEESSRVYQLELDRQLHEDRLKELKDYYAKVAAADYYSSEEKKNLLKSIGKDITNIQSEILTDTGKMSQLIREASTDTTSAAGIKAGFDHQRASLLLYYESLEQAAKDDADAVVALEEEKQRRIAALDYQYQEQVFQLQELTGLSWGQEFDRELLKLENMHEQGLISEKNYQKARLTLQVNNAKKYFDYYAQLSGSMFSAIQDAEIAKSDAKYDVLIQQAKNNGEDTAALEQEKENKKLEIQKKYADVNFAIKISQIVADTAVAVIKTFAELGYTPWGIAAAALMTATGVAQAATAKAERDRIKNMQPGVTGDSSSQPAKAQRVLSGYSEGGYTGDGDRYEVAGVVHRGEYVVPKPIMGNPLVIDAVGTIEAIRRNKLLTSGLPASSGAGSYADGGFTSPSQPADAAELTVAVKELREALRHLRAYVVYSDIERAEDVTERSRAPFTRNY